MYAKNGFGTLNYAKCNKYLQTGHGPELVD